MNLNRSKIFSIAAFVIFMTAYFLQKAIIHINAAKSLMFWCDFKKTDSSKGGYILLAPYVTTEDRFSHLVILDLARKKIITQKKVQGIVSDFRQWRIGGHTRYSYAVYDPAFFLLNYSNGSVGHIVILDSALNKIKEVRLLPHEDIVINGKQGLDHHDFIMLSDDHFVVMASYVKHVTNISPSLSPSPTVRIAAPIIQEINNGAVLWQWDASQYPGFYSASNKNNNFSDSSNVQDYMHINGLAIDPADSNLVVSFHNTDQLIKINRRSGDVMWRLGGKDSDFPLSQEQVFLRQHNPSFIDSGKTLMLFDNGDSTTRPYSRILEFNLDENGKKILSFKALRIPAPFAMSKGNVRLIGDEYIVCGGSANYILKINRSTGAVNTEIVYNQTSFRGYMTNDITGIPDKQK